MNSKRFTHFALLAVMLLFTCGVSVAQNFPGLTVNTAGNSLVPSSGSGGCSVVPQTTGGTTFNNTVAGLAANAAVTSVQLNMTHTWTGDLLIHLQSPTGQVIELATGVGGSGDNFTNTQFKDGSPNITSGTPPYSGMFAPEGTLTASTCGTTITPTVQTLAAFTPGQNGVWQLRFRDNAGGDIGTMISWSITFSVPPPPPSPCMLECPPDMTINLDPGFCEAIMSYPEPEQVGDCVFSVFAPGSITQNNDTLSIQDALQCGPNPTSHWRAYDLVAMGITGGFTMNNLGMASWSPGQVRVFVYLYTGPLPSNTLNTALMTLVGMSSAVPQNVGAFQHSIIPLVAPAVIPAGSKFVVEQRQISGGPWTVASNYAGATGPGYMNCIGSFFGFPATPTSYAALGYGYMHPIQVLNGLF
ncbi:MAG: proprotein convertase P-domain-containing protein, partial [Saprospiraceae bacterium]